MDKLRWDIEIGNAITVCAVIITAFICFIIIRIKLKKRKQTIEELEDTSGYNEKIDEIDNFINLKNAPKKLTTKIKNKIPFLKEKPVENKPAVNQNPSAMNNLETKIDQLVISMGTMKTDITTDLKKYVDQKTKKTG